MVGIVKVVMRMMCIYSRNDRLLLLAELIDTGGTG